MQVLVNIMLGPDEELNLAPDEIATAILEALDASPETTLVTANVQQPPVVGTAGVNPMLSPGAPPVPEQPA